MKGQAHLRKQVRRGRLLKTLLPLKMDQGHKKVLMYGIERLQGLTDWSTLTAKRSAEPVAKKVMELLEWLAS